MNPKLHPLFALTLSVALMNCQGNQSISSSAGRDTTGSSPVAVGTARCYAYASAQDTLRLMVSGTGEAVTGTLVYQLREKDRNVGTLRGQMRGDTLFAEYTFRSEGVESVREVAFLLRDNRAVEGYGTVTEQNGKVRFVSGSDLKFGSAFVLTQTDCAP